MVVWNSHVAEIIIILLGVVKRHVRFIRINFQSCFLQFSYRLLLFKLVSQRDGIELAKSAKRIAIYTFSVGVNFGTHGYFIANYCTHSRTCFVF
jgi:hypothetical protein